MSLVLFDTPTAHGSLLILAVNMNSFFFWNLIIILYAGIWTFNMNLSFTWQLFIPSCNETSS